MYFWSYSWSNWLTDQIENNTLIPFLYRHFLFKHGSGSSAIFNAANQNYPLTSSTVYSPPPRPLPRTTLSRPLFSFSKPYRCCNWKCTALSASAITLTLALLLTYIIGECLISPPRLYVSLFVHGCCHAGWGHMELAELTLWKTLLERWIFMNEGWGRTGDESVNIPQGRSEVNGVKVLFSQVTVFVWERKRDTCLCTSVYWLNFLWLSPFHRHFSGKSH